MSVGKGSTRDMNFLENLMCFILWGFGGFCLGVFNEAILV